MPTPAKRALKKGIESAVAATFSLKKFVVFMILTLWVVAMAVALIEKVALSSFGDVFIFFTNWAWTMQTFFYFLSWLFYFLPRFHDYAILYLFFMANGLAWIVMILVQLVIAQRPSFITGFFDKYSASIVIIANDVFHLLPVMGILIYILGCRELIHRGMHRMVYMTLLPRILLGIYQVFSPLLLMGIYAIFFDYHEVYHVEIPLYQIIIASVLSCVVFNGLPWLFFGSIDVERQYENIELKMVQ